jgi:SPP1 gp7 family putative phage head morphogenesis protein
MTKPLKELARELTRGQARLLEASRDERLDPVAKGMQSEMKAFFLKQGQLFLKEFTKFQSEFSEASGDIIDKIFGKVDKLTGASLAAIIEKGTGKALTQALGDMKSKFGSEISLTLKNPRAVKFIATNGAAKVTMINDTTREYIQTVLTEGLEQGWSYAKTAKAIKDRFAEFAIGAPQEHIRSRAELVAVTESANAYGQGNLMFAQEMQDAGLTMEKSWLTVGDDRVSEICQENEDAGWISVDDQFPSGDDAEPAHPSCRCTCLFQTVVGG